MEAPHSSMVCRTFVARRRRYAPFAGNDERDSLANPDRAGFVSVMMIEPCPPSDSEAFYAGVPVQRAFRALMDPARYTPLPDDWPVGIADVVQSTKAIAEKRYKAVNMAGAAVIAAVTNAVGGREFPFLFGGDGASFAVSPGDAGKAHEALAATAAWAGDELGLTLRVALIPVAAIRAQGRDVRVGRYGPSENLSYAMFSGGGLAWADAAVKRGEFAVPPAPPGTWPDLTGLSCRFEQFRAERGMILATLVLPASDADPAAYRALTEEIVALVERSPNAGRPIPAAGPKLGWPPQGVALETHTLPSGRFKRARVLARTLLYFLGMRSGLRVGSFVPARYLEQVVANSDFRKFDDGLRVVIDCTPELADALERRLAAAAAAGIVRYGLHQQDAAMMTCFTPAPTRSDHVHFIDGAQGGYAAAASAMKASMAPKQEARVHTLPGWERCNGPSLTYPISPAHRRRSWRPAHPAPRAHRRRRWRRRSCRRPPPARRLRAA